MRPVGLKTKRERSFPQPTIANRTLARVLLTLGFTSSEKSEQVVVLIAVAPLASFAALSRTSVEMTHLGLHCLPQARAVKKMTASHHFLKP